MMALGSPGGAERLLRSRGYGLFRCLLPLLGHLLFAGDCNGNCVSRRSRNQLSIDQVCFETIAENHHLPIHHYIPTLTFGPAIRKVAYIQK
jgi:hypothetical protein